MTKLYTVCIKYRQHDEEHELCYTSQRRTDCENYAIRYIAKSPIITVDSVIFTEEGEN